MEEGKTRGRRWMSGALSATISAVELGIPKTDAQMILLPLQMTPAPKERHCLKTKLVSMSKAIGEGAGRLVSRCCNHWQQNVLRRNTIMDSQCSKTTVEKAWLLWFAWLMKGSTWPSQPEVTMHQLSVDWFQEISACLHHHMTFPFQADTIN